MISFFSFADYSAPGIWTVWYGALIIWGVFLGAYRYVMEKPFPPPKVFQKNNRSDVWDSEKATTVHAIYFLFGAIIPWIWPLILVFLFLWLVLYAIRGMVRLQKALKAHKHDQDGNATY